MSELTPHLGMPTVERIAFGFLVTNSANWAGSQPSFLRTAYFFPDAPFFETGGRTFKWLHSCKYCA